jgi:hypothetical protein
VKSKHHFHSMSQITDHRSSYKIGKERRIYETVDKVQISGLRVQSNELGEFTALPLPRGFEESQQKLESMYEQSQFSFITNFCSQKQSANTQLRTLRPLRLLSCIIPVPAPRFASLRPVMLPHFHSSVAFVLSSYPQRKICLREDLMQRSYQQEPGKTSLLAFFQ